MPRIELPKGLTAITDFPRLRERVINMINTGENRLIPRPGIESKIVGEGVCRGQRNFAQQLYQVSGQKLIRIDEDGTIFNISDDQAIDITGTSNTEWAVGFTFMVFTEKGTGRTYAWDNSTLVEISGGGYVPAVDVEYIDGRWVWIPKDGGPAFYSDTLDPTTIAGFFDAETQPDLNTGVINLRNRLYIMGSDTIEPFRTLPTSPFFQRIEGASIWTGYVGGKCFWQETFAFLGKDKDQNFGFFIMGSGAAQRISDPAIDEILNQDYTVEELQSCLGQRIQWLGEDMAVFKLPRNTFVWNGVGWPEFQSVATVKEEQQINQEHKSWRANYMTHAYGKYYVGDGQTADIGMLSQIDTDYGEDIDRGYDTFIRADRGTYFTVKSLEQDGLAGQTSPQQTIGLAMSDDGKTYGDFFFVEMGEIGEYLERVFWELPGGLGDYESFAGVRIRTTAPVEIATEGLEYVV